MYTQTDVLTFRKSLNAKINVIIIKNMFFVLCFTTYTFK